MELIPIILAIIAITLFYFLYAYFSTKPTVLTDSVIKLSTHQSDFNDIPTINSNYAYGVWVFVSNVNSNTANFITRDNNFNLKLTGPDLVLELCTNSSSSTKEYVSIPYTDNFPIQKWTHVGFSLDNSYVDLYLDGKLIKSKLVKSNTSRFPEKPTGNSVKYGGPYSDNISITKFKYWNDSVMPDDMWDEYIAGNGITKLMNKFSSYGAQITILKDGIQQNMYSI